MPASTTNLTPTLTMALRQLRDLCDEPEDDEPDPVGRYARLTRVAAEAADANQDLRDHLVREHAAGRSIGGLPYYVAVTGALNAAANAGAFFSDPEAAYDRARVWWIPTAMR